MEPRAAGGPGGGTGGPARGARRRAGHGPARSGGRGRRCAAGLAGDARAADAGAGARFRGPAGLHHDRNTGRRQAGHGRARGRGAGQRLRGQPCGLAAGALRRAHRRAPGRRRRAEAHPPTGAGRATAVFDAVARAARMRRPGGRAAVPGRAGCDARRRMARALPPPHHHVPDAPGAGHPAGGHRCVAGARAVRADRLFGGGAERLRGHTAAAGHGRCAGACADAGRAARGGPRPGACVGGPLAGAFAGGTRGRSVAAGTGHAPGHPGRAGGAVRAGGGLACAVRRRLRPRLGPGGAAAGGRAVRVRGHLDRIGLRRCAPDFAAHHEHAVPLRRGARAQAAGQAGAGADAGALAAGDHRAGRRHGGLHPAHGRVVAGRQRETHHRISRSHHRARAGQRRDAGPLYRRRPHCVLGCPTGAQRPCRLRHGLPRSR